jgi:hypothetical protein
MLIFAVVYHYEAICVKHLLQLRHTFGDSRKFSNCIYFEKARRADTILILNTNHLYNPEGVTPRIIFPNPANRKDTSHHDRPENL